MTKTNESTAEPQSIKPPKRLRGWPTPILTQEDIGAYLIPLYARGWSIDYRQGNGNLPHSYAIPILQAFLEVSNWDRLRELGTLIQQLEASENHHVEVKLPDRESPLSSQQLLDSFDIEPPYWAAICLHTHSAILPRSEASDDEAEAKRRVSGLTLRDVRFAMLFDDLIKKHNAQTSDSNSKLVKDLTTVSAQPETLSDLLSGLDKDGSHHIPLP